MECTISARALKLRARLSTTSARAERIKPVVVLIGSIGHL